jgi:hypothetical protein
LASSGSARFGGRTRTATIMRLAAPASPRDVAAVDGRAVSAVLGRPDGRLLDAPARALEGRMDMARRVVHTYRTRLDDEDTVEASSLKLRKRPIFYDPQAPR